MSNFADEMNVRPRQRITIPEGHIALVVNESLASGLKTLCFEIRRKGKLIKTDSLSKIAGELLLAIVEAEQ